MGPVTFAVACAVVAVAAISAGAVARRRTLARQEQMVRDLAASQQLVARLASRVEELSEEVGRASRAAEREYVITSLPETTHSTAVPATSDHPEIATHRDRAPALGRALEEQLVSTLAHQRDVSGVRARAVDVAVRTVALGHGVRRALHPDVLDRAAAESHVARRRSRRQRKREIREARRLLRGDAA